MFSPNYRLNRRVLADFRAFRTLRLREEKSHANVSCVQKGGFKAVRRMRHFRTPSLCGQRHTPSSALLTYLPQQKQPFQHGFADLDLWSTKQLQHSGACPKTALSTWQIAKGKTICASRLGHSYVRQRSAWQPAATHCRNKGLSVQGQGPRLPWFWMVRPSRVRSLGQQGTCCTVRQIPASATNSIHSATLIDRTHVADAACGSWRVIRPVPNMSLIAGPMADTCISARLRGLRAFGLRTRRCLEPDKPQTNAVRRPVIFDHAQRNDLSEIKTNTTAHSAGFKTTKGRDVCLRRF